MFTTGTREQRFQLSDSLVNKPPLVNRFVRTGPHRHLEPSAGANSSGRWRFVPLMRLRLRPPKP